MSAFREALKRDAIEKLEPRLRALYDSLVRKNIDLAEFEESAIRTAGFYEGQANVNDEIVVTTMTKIEWAIEPAWAAGPEWPVVQQAAPTKITAGARPKGADDGHRRIVVFPDPQIGYWRNLDTNELTAMHDEAAIDCALEIAKAVQPHQIVNLGDYLDLAEFSSKFAVHPEFVHTTQASIDYGHRLLARQRAILGPDGDLALLAGNHDDRLGKCILQNARAALRLRRAEDPESWPVMSVPYVLRVDDLGCTYVDGYPAGSLKLADGTDQQSPLFAVHERGLDMAKVAKAQRQSYVQGHKHTVAMHSETYELDGQPVDVESWSFGCLCRNDGFVPSTKGASSDRGGAVRRIESWQHAVGVITVAPSGAWSIEGVRIRDGVAMFRGKEYRA